MDLDWYGWLLGRLLLCQPLDQLLLHYVCLSHLVHVLKRDPLLVVLEAGTVISIFLRVHESVTRQILPLLSPPHSGSLDSLILPTLLSASLRLPEVLAEAVRAFILQVVKASITANDIGVSACPIRLVM